jgi:4-aminobutyrate aminotransferase-like enzyme
MVGGLSGSVFRLQPPLTIAEEQAVMVVEAFDKILRKAG